MYLGWPAPEPRGGSNQIQARNVWMEAGEKIKRFRWKQYIEFPGVSSRACCSDISLFRVATYPTGDGTKAREGGRKPNIKLAANQKGNSNIVTECNSDFLSSMGSREWREMPLCPGQD